MDRARLLQLAVTGSLIAGVSLTTFGLTRAAAPAPVEVRLTDGAPTPGAAPVDGRIKVYVAGAVQRPGVYPVSAGDRVADVLEAAGGPSDDADLLAINLARRLRDEDAVIVPRQGDVVVPPLASGDSPAGARPPGPINLNTASAATLETLTGIGAARAARIIDSRTKLGPFRASADLVSRKLIPQSVFDEIKAQITVE